MDESHIEAGCKEVAVRFGGRMYKTTWPSRRGGPDDILVLPFMPVVFVELKTYEGRQSPIQKIWEQDLVGMGQRYWLVRSIESFEIRVREFVAYERGRMVECSPREKRPR